MSSLLTLKQIQNEYGLTKNTIRCVARAVGIRPKGKIGRENLYGPELTEELDKRFRENGVTDDMLQATAVIKGTGWSRHQLRQRCKLYEVTPVYQSGKAYYSRSMINKLMNDERKLVSIREFAAGDWTLETELRLYMAGRDTHHVSMGRGTYYRRASLEEAYRSEEIREALEEKAKMTKEYVLKYIRRLKIEPDDEMERIIEKVFEYIGPNGKPETRRLLKDYLIHDITRIRRKKNPSAELRACLKKSIRLLDELSDEIHLLSDDDIRAYLTGVSISYAHFCIRFIKFVAQSGQSTAGRFDVVVKTRKSKKVKPYTDDEWFGLQELLIDVDRHFDRALKDYCYCRIWLFMLIHCICALRATDITNFPMPQDYVIRKREDITSELVARVSDEVTKRLSAHYTKKTQAQIFPATPSAYLKEAFVTALLLCGMHARAEGKTRLFPANYVNGMYKLEEKRFFSGTEMQEFVFLSSRANHSFMTKLHRIGLKKGSSVYSVYGLISKMRSHVVDAGYESETTVEYISATEGEKDINEVVLALMGRGCFGYVYETLLYAMTGADRKALGHEDVTHGVKLLRDAFLPAELEAITGQLLNIRDEREKVIEELLAMSHETLSEMAHDIATDRRTCKVPGVYCASPSPCPYHTAIGGIGCKYAVMTADAVHKLNDATIEHIDRMVNAANENVFKKEERQVTALLGTCADFVKTFRGCGQGYIAHFIDLPRIKEQLGVLSKRKEIGYE